MKTYLLKKIIISMSFNLFAGIILSCALAGSLVAEETKAQIKSIKEVYIDIHLTGAPIKTVLEAIEAKTLFRFTYGEKVLAKTKKPRLTIEFDDESVAGVLKQIARETGFQFKQRNNTIAVSTNTTKQIPLPVAKPLPPGLLQEKSPTRMTSPCPGPVSL